MSVSCRGLRVVARGRQLLAVDFLEVADGETLAVLGPNGAGKSTLLRAFARLEPAATCEQVLLDGEPATPAQLRAAVAAVLQRPILQRASVLDNAAAGLRLRGMRRARARRLARPWLDSLGVGHLADRHARTLSGGEAQRVAIARALAVRSRVLLLDEPFAGLDATTRADLIADLRAALNHSSAAVLLVTHDRDEADALAHRTALLVQGLIRQLGATARVLDSPADLECADLLGYTTRLPPELTGHDVLLVARPERCRLLPRGVAPAHPGVVVSGTLRRVVPLGGTTRVDVDTAAGPIAVLTTTEVTIAPGDPLCVTVDARHTRECPPRPESVGPREVRRDAAPIDDTA
ncbi:MAG TPA: ABC transporter ATP-binding protein [Pseudonocardia sp.]|nr:ABC transporter ATP-binding protein [Pseudonocardia sp.]